MSPIAGGYVPIQRKCPRCGHSKTRRSAVRTYEQTPRLIFLSPYRCPRCQHRFWVVSRRVYYLAAFAGAALLIGAATWNLATLADIPEPVRPAPPPDNFTTLFKRAQGNDSDAQYELARMYMNGEGVSKNETEAREWLERAAGKGNIAAEYELGMALRDGRGVVQDYRSAAKWIQRAAEHGYPQAQLALGVMYRSGTGVPLDHAKAYTWLNVAAARGVSDAIPLRDAVLSRLSAQEIIDAQTEAKRLSEDLPVPPATVRQEAK